MKYFSKILFFLLLFCSFEYGESIIDTSTYSNHMELFIHQDIINNFLHSIGEIKGKGKMTIIGYNWTVSNANIAINEEKSEFYADVKLEYGDLSRTDLIIGKVTVDYSHEENVIYVQISDASIDIDISDIFKIIPEDVVNINIDISSYFAEPFKIQAPQPKTTTYPVPMSPDSTKVIVLNNTETKLFLVENGIKIVSIYHCIKE